MPRRKADRCRRAEVFRRQAAKLKPVSAAGSAPRGVGDDAQHQKDGFRKKVSVVNVRGYPASCSNAGHSYMVTVPPRPAWPSSAS